MRIPISIFLICLFVLAPASTLALAQDQQNAQKNAQQPAQQQAATTDKPKPTGPYLAEDTPIKLRLMQNLTSKTAKVNDKVDFEVIEPIKVGDAVVIDQGGLAIATVTRATPKKSFGRAGKLDVNIDYVRLANGDKANLRAIKGGSGGSRTAVMTTAVVATAIVFFPAAPLFFFIKGKNIEIPKGTEITAYVAADTAINIATLPSSNQIAAAAPTSTDAPTSAASDPTAASAPAETTNTSAATVLIKSDPAGADISVDDKFMGTTLSTLKLTAGEHTITIVKAGYKEWKRTITVNVGSEITLDAALEKLPQP